MRIDSFFSASPFFAKSYETESLERGQVFGNLGICFLKFRFLSLLDLDVGIVRNEKTIIIHVKYEKLLLF